MILTTGKFLLLVCNDKHYWHNLEYSQVINQSKLILNLDKNHFLIIYLAMHFHVPPPNPDGTRPSSRQMNAYTANLRSRSQSRTGMKVLVDQLDVSIHFGD